jgi:hypothetical protein
MMPITCALRRWEGDLGNADVKSGRREAAPAGRYVAAVNGNLYRERERVPLRCGRLPAVIQNLEGSRDGGLTRGPQRSTDRSDHHGDRKAGQHRNHEEPQDCSAPPRHLSNLT